MTAAIVAEITSWHRRRVFAMEQRKRCDLTLGAFLRIQLGWSRTLPEKDRKRIAGEAAALIADPENSEWADVIAAANGAALPFNKIEDAATKQMEVLARQLPAWKSFAEDVRGFGAASLAVIVAEAGDLSNYATKEKLWKRMGFAVFDGVRQGGLPANAPAAAWIAHGYNRKRRSRVWNIGDCLVKGNRDGIYRTVYLERKAYELARDPEMKPMKAHLRAQRYMEKRLLRDLWRAWRRATRAMAERPMWDVPAATHSAPEWRPDVS